jgi:poly(A) polymerase
MKLKANWLSEPNTQTLIRAFALAGCELRFVGGCVRDTLLERDVSDIDVATPAQPDAVMTFLKQSHIKAIPTGIEHGTITAVIQNQSFEITTLRRDTTCDGRHADVEFTDNWQKDAARRDFTMNALYLSVDGELHDYHQGVKDAEHGIIRFIGNPEERIKEDALRILRFFRFYAYYGNHTPESSALNACQILGHQLQTLSGERIQQEMLKLLNAPNPSQAIHYLQETGANKHIGLLPTTSELFDHLVICETKAQRLPSPMRRLGLWLKESKTNLDNIIKTWRLSKAHHHILKTLGEHTYLKPYEDDLVYKTFLRHWGKPLFVDLALISAAKHCQKNDDLVGFVEMMTLADDWHAPTFPLSGEDLIQIGYTPGLHLGKALTSLEAFWEASNYQLTKEELLAQANHL